MAVEFKVKNKEKEDFVAPEAVEKAVKKGRRVKKQKRKVKEEASEVPEVGQVQRKIEQVPEPAEIVHHEVVKKEETKEVKQPAAAEKASKRTFWFYP